MLHLLRMWVHPLLRMLLGMLLLRCVHLTLLQLVLQQLLLCSGWHLRGKGRWRCCAKQHLCVPELRRRARAWLPCLQRGL